MRFYHQHSLPLRHVHSTSTRSQWGSQGVEARSIESRVYMCGCGWAWRSRVRGSRPVPLDRMPLEADNRRGTGDGEYVHVGIETVATVYVVNPQSRVVIRARNRQLAEPSAPSAAGSWSRPPPAPVCLHTHFMTPMSPSVLAGILSWSVSATRTRCVRLSCFCSRA